MTKLSVCCLKKDLKTNIKHKTSNTEFGNKSGVSRIKDILIGLEEKVSQSLIFNNF